MTDTATTVTRALVDAVIHDGWVALPELGVNAPAWPEDIGSRGRAAAFTRAVRSVFHPRPGDTLAVVETETMLRFNGGAGVTYRTGYVQTATATVDEVLPIRLDPLDANDDCIEAWEGGANLWRANDCQPITLPGAAPGGVALRLTVTPHDPTPVTVTGNGPIRTIKEQA